MVRKLFLGIVASGLMYSMQGTDKKNVDLAVEWALTESPMDIAVFVPRSRSKHHGKMLRRMGRDRITQLEVMRERPLFAEPKKVLQAWEQLADRLQRGSVGAEMPNNLEFFAGICHGLQNQDMSNYSQPARAAAVFAKCAYYAAQSCVPTPDEQDAVAWNTLQEQLKNATHVYAKRAAQQYNLPPSALDFDSIGERLSSEKDKPYMQTVETLPVLAECAYHAWKKAADERVSSEVPSAAEERLHALSVHYFDQLHQALPKEVDLSESHVEMVNKLLPISSEEEVAYVLAINDAKKRPAQVLDDVLFNGVPDYRYQTIRCILERACNGEYKSIKRKELFNVCAIFSNLRIAPDKDEIKEILRCIHVILHYARKKNVQTLYLGYRTRDILDKIQQRYPEYYEVLAQENVPLIGYDDVVDTDVSKKTQTTLDKVKDIVAPVGPRFANLWWMDHRRDDDRKELNRLIQDYIHAVEQLKKMSKLFNNHDNEYLIVTELELLDAIEHRSLAQDGTEIKKRYQKQIFSIAIDMSKYLMNKEDIFCEGDYFNLAGRFLQHIENNKDMHAKLCDHFYNNPEAVGNRFVLTVNGTEHVIYDRTIYESQKK